MKRLIAALCAFFLTTAMVVTTDTPVHNLFRSSILVGSYPTHDACVAAAVARNVSTAYECRATSTVTVQLVAGPKPADETRVSACPMAGLPGNLSWTQTRTYAAVPAPVFWQAQQWLPSAPQPPACVPLKPADETQMVTCPAGSITGAQWMQTRTYVAAPAPQFWSAQAWTPAQPQAGACPPAPPPPMMHGGINIDTSVPFPTGSLGRDVEMLLSPPQGLTPGANGTGDFRTVCDFSHMSFDDPIVYPGQPGKAHLHAFVGNTGTNAFSTYDNMALGKSTCRGGAINQSAYWMPPMVDKTTGIPIRPKSAIIYYKQGNGDLHPELVQAFPKGLRMIAGDPSGTAGVRFGPISFSCSGFPFSSDGWEPFNGGTHVIPDSCPFLDDQWKTHEVWAVVSFPDCWDGVNLDSPDHKSHMSYWPSPNRNPDGSSRETCPPDHPVKLPQLTIIFIYTIPTGADIRNWDLSCQMSGQRGSCLHADVMERWNRNGGPNKDIDRFQQFVNGCLRKTLDCGASLLDADTEILGFDGN